MSVISITLNVSGVYYWTNNKHISIEHILSVEMTLFTLYKIWTVVNHSNDICNCLPVTWYGFTFSGLRNRYVLDKWRLRSVWSTTTMAVAYCLPVILYLCNILTFNNNIIQVKKNNDGTMANYRQNIIKLYVFASDETYNAHLTLQYILFRRGMFHCQCSHLIHRIWYSSGVTVLGYLLSAASCG